MSSFIAPSFVLGDGTKYPLMDTIKDTTDLQYIDRRLLEYGFSQTEADLVEPCQSQPGADYSSLLTLVAQNTANFIQHAASGSFEPDLPESSYLRSPDSSAPCDSPECPIKGIPHNEGRYFHGGEVPRRASDSHPGFTIKGSSQDISDTFNHTVPPPEIVTAYLKTCVGIHSQGDSDMVKQYQKHHVWSPLVSEVSTPWPRDLYPYIHGLHGQAIRDGTNADTKAGVVPQDIGTSLNFSDRNLGTRSIHVYDFENSDDEDEISIPPRNENRKLQGSSRPLPSSEADRRADDDCEICPTLEMPQGEELDAKRLQIQEGMLRKMAEHQRQKQANRGSFCRWIRKDSMYSECHHNDRDVNLEILLALMEALPKALGEGGLRSILLENKYDNKGFSNSERQLICDLQMILRQVLADTISNAKQAYQPTGLPVTTAQLETALFSAISWRRQILSSEPERSTAGLLDHFSRDWRDIARQMD